MCVIIGIIAPHNSGVDEVMDFVANDLYDKGNRVTILRTPRFLPQVRIIGVDYLILRFPLNEWKDLRVIKSRFGENNMRLFTHVPLWKGETRKGQVELVDLNWALWCAVHSVANTGKSVTLTNIRKSYYSSLELLYHLPKMFREYKAISIANNEITELKESCKVMNATIDEIADVFKQVNDMNPNANQMKLMILLSI